MTSLIEIIIRIFGFQPIGVSVLSGALGIFYTLLLFSLIASTISRGVMKFLWFSKLEGILFGLMILVWLTNELLLKGTPINKLITPLFLLIVIVGGLILLMFGMVKALCWILLSLKERK